MDTTEIVNKAKENLCYYDKENPDNNLDIMDLDDNEIEVAKKDCYCFYGRTELANIILNLLKHEQNNS